MRALTTSDAPQTDVPQGWRITAYERHNQMKSILGSGLALGGIGVTTVTQRLPSTGGGKIYSDNQGHHHEAP